MRTRWNRCARLLSVLGEEYLAHYDALVSGGYLEVYPTDTNVAGAYTYTIGDEFPRMFMLNYMGYDIDVDTLAHEMGHAVYEWYAIENQRTPSMRILQTLRHEVASTTNELLYYSLL